MTRYETIGGVITDPNYWDCECDVDYIHHMSDVEPCDQCGAVPDEQPNSHVAEIHKVFDAFQRAEHDDISEIKS